MRKFKRFDKVVFVADLSLYRRYKPAIGDIGVVRDFAGIDEYKVVFGDDENNWTICEDTELTLYDDTTTDFEKIVNGNFNVKEIYPESFICSEGSRGYGKSITNRYLETEIKVDAIHTKIVELENKMEGKEMKNEVLELWYKRENAKLKSEFKSEIEKYVNEHPIVVKYKEIVSEFTDSMTALLAEYADSEDFNLVSSLSYSVLDDVDLHDIEKKLQDMYLKNNVAEHEKMLSKLQDTYETIKAMLSLSDDLEYQLDVLSKYKVIDKKTKKMVD